MWADDFDRIFATMRDTTPEDKETRLRMSGIQKLLQDTCKKDPVQISNLHAYLDELDHRRGTNWKLLFPYLIC